MMQTASRTIKQSASLTRRRLFSQTTTGSVRGHKFSKQHCTWVACTTAVAVGTVWYATRERIHNDASETPSPLSPTAQAAQETVVRGVSPIDGSLATLVWGSNRTHILFSDDQVPESIRTPAVADWLKDVALRDLVLHEQHAACIDARGDVYQWGDGFFGPVDSRTAASSSGKPVLTLRSKNITQLQATPDRVFALSASGRIYVLSANMAKQELPLGAPTPSSTPWWGTGWMWGEEEQVDFAEVTPHEKLSRGEKFISIAAGNDHLLALTSSGRTFAHPINLKANAYGQLGFRKFDIPDRSVSASHRRPHLHPARRQIELTPKFIADPYANASPAARPSSSSGTDQAATAADSDIHWSDELFEIPALRGVHIEQIAAGGRSSFTRTDHGRVLGWGANEFGQIGLGGNVTLSAITVPTEIILWRSTPQTMRTTCLDVYAGGDLTFFKVERTDGSAMPYIDVLACGNGQYGGLGNAGFTNSQGTPVRTRNVSGLLEYSEKSNNLQPIYPHDISISPTPTGHVLLTLDTLARSGAGGGGRDLLVWGANQEYQLGNGKRGSVASPLVLHAPDGQRLMLGKRPADVKDLSGKLWKKGVQVEQCAVAGWGNSLVYWKILP